MYPQALVRQFGFGFDGVDMEILVNQDVEWNYFGEAESIAAFMVDLERKLLD